MNKSAKEYMSVYGPSWCDVVLLLGSNEFGYIVQDTDSKNLKQGKPYLLTYEKAEQLHAKRQVK